MNYVNGDDYAARVQAEVREAFAAELGLVSLTDDPAAPLGQADVDRALAHLQAESDQAANAALIAERLDWAELFADETEEEWVSYPLVPARRHVSLYSPPKVGKSLLLLELAVSIARGLPFLGSATKRQRVLYVDFENDPRGDVRERLEAMGVGPEDLEDLVYLSYPSFSALNSPAGGRQLVANIEHYQCGVVVIDTVSRAIQGEENSNDTWLGFYAHTGLKLKQLGVAMVRLDHTGKDETKGARGGSAKAGDVDAVWSLTKVSGSVFKLECTHKRFRLDAADSVMTLHREVDPVLRHVSERGTAAIRDAKVQACLADLERLEIDPDWGRDKARAALREAGAKHSNGTISDAIRVRRNSQEPVPDRSAPVLAAEPVPDRSGQVDLSEEQNTLSGIISTCPGQVGDRSEQAHPDDLSPCPPISDRGQVGGPAGTGAQEANSGVLNSGETGLELPEEAFSAPCPRCGELTSANALTALGKCTRCFSSELGA